jgi:cytochrome c oxidase subunit 4
MTAESAEHTKHILPLRLYLAVGGALIVLTAVTVAVSFLHFGGWNVVVALSIAAIKATLVAMFFMHLKYDNKLYLFIFIVAVLFLAVFIVFTMFDTMTRDQIYDVKAGPITPDATIYQSNPADTSGTVADSTSVHR